MPRRGEIGTKRWNDPVAPSDGFRLLVCRYRPRALPKAHETWDEWRPELGASPELHAAFWGNSGPPIGWGEYRRRYLREMKGRADAVRQIAADVAEGRTLTLLCSSACVDARRCHRTLLRGLVERQLARRLVAR